MMRMQPRNPTLVRRRSPPGNRGEHGAGVGCGGSCI